jgi:hypothetical protein
MSSGFVGETLETTLGRFWVLTDDEDIYDEVDSNVEAEGQGNTSEGAMSYLRRACATPTKGKTRDLPSDGSARWRKRLEKRSKQRITISSYSHVPPRSKTLDFRQPLWSRRPMLDSSTFCLQDEMEMATWTMANCKNIKDIDLRDRRDIACEDMQQLRFEFRTHVIFGLK